MASLRFELLLGARIHGVSPVNCAEKNKNWSPRYGFFQLVFRLDGDNIDVSHDDLGSGQIVLKKDTRILGMKVREADKFG